MPSVIHGQNITFFAFNTAIKAVTLGRNAPEPQYEFQPEWEFPELETIHLNKGHSMLNLQKKENVQSSRILLNFLYVLNGDDRSY